MGLYPTNFATVRRIVISSPFYFSKDATYNSISPRHSECSSFFVHIEYTEKQTYCDVMQYNDFIFICGIPLQLHFSETEQ